MGVKARIALGGMLAVGPLVVRVLNAYQTLDGLLSSLRNHGAPVIADAITSAVMQIALAFVGVLMIGTALKKRASDGGNAHGQIAQFQSGGGQQVHAAGDIHGGVHFHHEMTLKPPTSTSVERYEKEQADAKARFHTSRLDQLKQQKSETKPPPPKTLREYFKSDYSVTTLKSAQEATLTIDESQVPFTIQGYFDFPPGRSSSGTTFHRVVTTLNHEDNFTTRQAADLEDLYRQRNLDLLLRGPEYASVKNALQRANV